MCGIVGVVAKRPVAGLLIDGLKKLEYRGYDSAGLAIINRGFELTRIRVAGKVRELEHAMHAVELHGETGIAHTRWATHGAPSELNAHPFISNDEFALVHNGIIENHTTLRDQLLQAGYNFTSETDTEVVVHLIHQHFMHEGDLIAAIRKATLALEGAYSLGVISKHHPGKLIAVRQGSPLVIGHGQEENYLASDPLALLALTKRFSYLEDDDIAEISLEGVNVFDKNQRIMQREQHVLTISTDVIDRGPYRHYMQKEIMDQPKALKDCCESRLSKQHVLSGIFGPQAETIFATVKHIQLVACGTSYHAALVAGYWIESLTRIPCSVEIASEFRYRGIAKPEDSLFVTLSQSGETADTLAALRLAKRMHYVSTLAICNVPGSTIMREADLHFLTRAGIEIGVASTKAFTTQLVALFLLALVLRRKRGDQLEIELTQHLHQLPQMIEEILLKDDLVQIWAKAFTDKSHALFLGRGPLYPIALEGALKMKEISYIHSEGYPAGELKHGPLALVDKHMPVVAIAPGDELLEKTLSNLHEVRARGGNLFVLTDQIHLFDQPAFEGSKVIAMPRLHALLNPILYTIVLQLLAYHVAVLKGTDVDQPRNLAKSVTVE